MFGLCLQMDSIPFQSNKSRMEYSSSAIAELLPEQSEPLTINQYVEDFIYDFSSNSCKYELFSEQDYLGPCKVVQIQAKGRGLAATQNIHPGQLVIAAKALAIVHGETVGSDSATRQNHVLKFQALQESLVSLIKSSKEHTKRVLNLYAGPELGCISEDSEIGESTEPIHDLNKWIVGICVHNSFEGHQIRLNSSFSLNERPGSSYGLWYFPSFLNHTCFDANCHWSIFGNLMIIRSTRAIAEGEELLISYIDPHQPYKKRCELFIQHCFQCECLLCNHDRLEGQRVCRERETVLSNFCKEIVESDINYNNVDLIQRCINKVKSLHTVQTQPTNLHLIKPLMQLGLAQYELGDWQASAESFAQVYEYCIPISQFALFRLSCVLTIITCHVRCQKKAHPDNISALKENAHVQDWKQKLQQCLLIQYGADSMRDRNKITKLLEAIRPSFVQEMQSNDLLNWLTS